MTEETKKPSRLAAWAETLRNAPDDRGVGIGRTLVLSVVVGIFAGLGAIALVSMLHFFDWLFLGWCSEERRRPDECRPWLEGAYGYALCLCRCQPHSG